MSTPWVLLHIARHALARRGSGRCISFRVWQTDLNIASRLLRHVLIHDAASIAKALVARKKSPIKLLNSSHFILLLSKTLGF